MKKVLFATTAIVAFAGAASADIAISGYAEMGIEGGNEVETQFHQDIDVTFSMTGETDNGLSFGASVDLDETAAGTNNADDNGTTVFISGAFGTLTMGDTDGAMDWALTEGGNVGNPGSIDDNETVHAGYLGAYLDGNEDGQILRYDYSIGALGIAASVELDDTGAATTTAGAGTLRNAFTSAGAAVAATFSPASAGVTTDDTVDSGDTSMALGLKYGMDLGGGSLTLGVAYQSAADRVAYISSTTDTTTANSVGINTVSTVDTTAVGVSAVYSANGLSVGAAITQYSDYAGINATLTAAQIADTTADTVAGSLSDMTHTSVGIGYTTGAISLHANYGELDYDAAAIADVDGYGIAAKYDLGGGASVHLGMNDNDTGADYSFGLAMSF